MVTVDPNARVFRFRAAGRDQRPIEYAISADDFVPAAPADAGGIHPEVVHEIQTWLHINDPNCDFTGCLHTPVFLSVDPPDANQHVEGWYYEIEAWLQAPYGPDLHIVSVPIDGDADAQRLHWQWRDDAGRAEMEAVLRAIGQWRLNDDGTVPTAEEVIALRLRSLHPDTPPPPPLPAPELIPIPDPVVE